MDEQITSEFPKGFVEPLLEFCAAPDPEPAFVSGLERQLLARQAELRSATQPGQGHPRHLWAKFIALLRRSGWGYFALVLLAALAIALFAIGPQRVLAQVQRWLGYVPGIGFVNLAETRALASPVEVTRGGVTLRVEQVIAGPQRTQVLISVPGLSEADLPWPNAVVENSDFSASLLLPEEGLPDGIRLEMTRWELSVGAGKLEFPPLPGGVNRVTLVVPRLPLAPAGALPEDWEIPLSLRPLSGELNQALFPQPYSPPDASDSHHGITLRVLDVAQSATETAVHYQVEWANPDWESRFGLGVERMPELRDDLGHIYWESPGSHGSSVAVVAIAIPTPDASQATPTPAAPNHADTLVFPALSLSASQATLWVDALEFQVPAQGSFSLNLGPNPKIGDSWPLDVRLEVAGFPAHLTAARLREETVETGDGHSEKRAFLEFDLDPLEEQDGLSLAGFDLANPQLGVHGQGGRSISNGVERYTGRLEFPTGKLPSGRVELQVMGASLLVRGPWEATWTVPGRDPASLARPVRLFPAAKGGYRIPGGQRTPEQPDGALRPVVAEAFLSDRLTAVKFEAAGLPPGDSLVQALAYDPTTFDLYRLTPGSSSTRPPGLYLEDNWGRRYEPGGNQAVIRPDGDNAGYDPRWRYFPPLEPLAQSLSLHVPGMEVYEPGEASFEVEVPREVTFKPEEYTETVIGGGGPQRQVTETRWVSDPWMVNIAFDLAGYHLRFTQAQLERDERSDPPYRLLLTGDPPAEGQGGSHLIELRFAQVEQPDGETLRTDPALESSGMISFAHGGVGLQESGSSQLQAGIFLDVTAADRIDLLPGRYRVELNGVTVWVPGPWDLRWSLTNP
jgi:hypothetical protein